MWQHAEKGFA
jgi:hypothetical protein